MFLSLISILNQRRLVRQASVSVLALAGSLLFCLLADVFVSGCGATQPRFESSPPTGLQPQMIVFASGRGCDRRRHQLMMAARTEAAELSEVMHTLGGPTPMILHDPRAREVETRIRRVGPGPLLLLFIGHGVQYVGADGVKRSALCLADGQLPIEHILTWLPTHLSHAVIVLDMCSSAHVDVRRSPVPTSVISATPSLVNTQRSAPLLTGILIEALRHEGDLDHPCGIRSDEELFSFIDRQSSVPRIHPLLPKLRRNTRHQLLLPVRASSARNSEQACPVDPYRSEPQLARRIATHASALHRGGSAPRDEGPPLWSLDESATNVASLALRTSALTVSRTEAEQLAILIPTLLIYAVGYDARTREIDIRRLPGGQWAGRAMGRPERALTEATLQQALASASRIDGDVLYFPEVAPSLDDPVGAGLVASPCHTSKGQCFSIPKDTP
jgi:hypothetical protein